MSKYTRKVIGSVYKSKEKSEPDYIKIRDDITLKAGQIVKLESAAFQVKSVESAVNAGKLTPELGDTIKERIEKIPEWVRFEMVLLEKKQ